MPENKQSNFFKSNAKANFQEQDTLKSIMLYDYVLILFGSLSKNYKIPWVVKLNKRKKYNFNKSPLVKKV